MSFSATARTPSALRQPSTAASARVHKGVESGLNSVEATILLSALVTYGASFWLATVLLLGWY